MNEIEKTFLHELIRDEQNLKTAVLAGVTKHFFQFTETRNLFLIIEYNFKKYHQVLKSDTLQSWLQKSQHMTQEAQAQVAVLFEEIKLLPDFSDFNVLLEDFFAYYKINAIKASLDRSVDFLANHQPDKAMSQLKTDIVTLERAVSPKEVDSGYFAANFQDKIKQYLDKKANPEKYKGIDLGFSIIDGITNGLPKDSATIIMGEQKSAKSVLLVNIAMANFLKGKRVYYHSNEGGKEIVENRLICRGTGLVMDKIERQQLSDAEFDTYEKFLIDKSGHFTKGLYLDSVPRSLSTTSYIQRKVTELQEDGPVDLIIIDYMSLMKPDDIRGKQTYEELGEVAMALKELAMKIKIPVVTIMHVNRNGIKNTDKDHFGIEDMGLSMEPAKHVDLVMSWRLKDVDELKRSRMGQGVLSIELSRFCGAGAVTLQINTNLMRISEYDLSKVLH